MTDVTEDQATSCTPNKDGLDTYRKEFAEFKRQKQLLQGQIQGTQQQQQQKQQQAPQEAMRKSWSYHSLEHMLDKRTEELKRKLKWEGVKVDE